MNDYPKQIENPKDTYWILEKLKATLDLFDSQLHHIRELVRKEQDECLKLCNGKMMDDSQD